MTDPAADIMAFLLSVPADWQPEVCRAGRELIADEEQALERPDDRLAQRIVPAPARRAIRQRRHSRATWRRRVKVDEQVLVGKFRTTTNRTQRQLEYVARRSLSRYGCFGCHDIPGYETAKPIGTPLASWGRKDPSQLAFENIGQFLATHGIDGTKRRSARARERDGAASTRRAP